MSNPTMDHKVDLPLSLRTWCDPAVGARLSNRAADEIERLRAIEARLDAAICLHLSLDPDGPGDCTDRLVAAVEDAGRRLRAVSAGEKP